MHAIVHAPDWAQFIFKVDVVLIIAFYLWIAWQFWDARSLTKIGGENSKKARKSLSELVAIFVLCACSGYVPTLFFAAYPLLVAGSWPVMLASHTLLAFWAGKYAVSRQPAHIMARLG